VWKPEIQRSSSVPVATCLFPPGAKWIWLPTPQRDKNSYACFRRSVELGERPKSARVRVTADSRYELPEGRRARVTTVTSPGPRIELTVRRAASGG